MKEKITRIIKRLPISHLEEDRTIESIMELMPQWYKTSELLPGDYPVKEPENGQTIISHYDLLECKYIPNCHVYYKNHATPAYWYPVEPLDLKGGGK